jgi:hypothetical protein
MPLCASILVRNCHFFRAKLVFALSLLGINFVLMLPLLVLTLPLLLLDPILMHHHAHHVFEQKSIFIAVVCIMGRLLL